MVEEDHLGVPRVVDRNVVVVVDDDGDVVVVSPGDVGKRLGAEGRVFRRWRRYDERREPLGKYLVARREREGLRKGPWTGVGQPQFYTRPRLWSSLFELYEAGRENVWDE